jgi:hypothetical protein
LPTYPGRMDTGGFLAQAAQGASSTAVDLLNSVSQFNPILNLGLGGVLVFLIIKRIGIMPTYVFKDAKAEWDRERVDLQNQIEQHRVSCAADRDRVEVDRVRERDQARKDNDEAQATIKGLTTTIVEQVVPAVTRVAGPLLDLVRIKEAEERRDDIRRNEPRRSGGSSGGR